MPRFYAEEMEAFLSGLGLDPNERIFPVTKHFLNHETVRGSKAADITYRYPTCSPASRPTWHALDGARREN